MRSNALALLTGAIVLVGCSGGGDAGSGDTATPAGGTKTGTPAGGAPPGGAAGTATLAPITGQIHTVRMIGDGTSYSYQPSTINAKAGDGVKFIMVSGPPHNVAFSPDSLPDAVEPQLKANMPESADPLEGKMLMQPNEEYTLSLGNIPAGRYPFHCTPHLAFNMRGVLNITP